MERQRGAGGHCRRRKLLHPAGVLNLIMQKLSQHNIAKLTDRRQRACRQSRQGASCRGCVCFSQGGDGKYMWLLPQGSAAAVAVCGGTKQHAHDPRHSHNRALLPRQSCHPLPALTCHTSSLTTPTNPTHSPPLGPFNAHHRIAPTVEPWSC
jgi:hypothetical protein